MTKPGNTIQLPPHLRSRIQLLVTRGHFTSFAHAIRGLLTGALNSEEATVPDDLVQRVDGLVDSGRYSSREDALHDLLGRAVRAFESVRPGEIALWPV